MTDLIKREDAIEALRVAYFDKDIQSAKDDPCIVDAMTDWAIRRIKSLPSADRPTWIPCSERLPSEKDYISDVVIWCTDKSMVGVGWYYESTKSWATIDDTFPPILGEVIAWMPLPEPYREEE